MGIESGTYVTDLVATNPPGTDPKSQGDDHLRLIKSVLKNTFPGADGAVNVEPATGGFVGVPGLEFPDGTRQSGAGAQGTGPNGWIRFPGGLIVQWGVSLLEMSNVSGGGAIVTFPLAFPNTVWAVVSSMTGSNNSGESSKITEFSCQGQSINGFSQVGRVIPGETANVTVNFNWVAIGL
jgi:hypothetical protein